MSVRHLLSAADLTRDQATAILDDADRFRQALLGRDVKKLPTLRGRTVITMFYENSTRTRVSFEVAGKWMSADVINVSSSGSSVAKGESLRDTALTLRAAGADALIIRHPASGAAQQLAEWTRESDGTGPSSGAGAQRPTVQPCSRRWRRSAAACCAQAWHSRWTAHRRPPRCTWGSQARPGGCPI